jgi:hypothetical protein
MTRTKPNETQGHRDRPEVQMGTLWITASWIGAVLSLGLGFMVYEAPPKRDCSFWARLGLES